MVTLRRHLKNKGVDYLEFSMRASCALANSGISTIGQLLDHSRSELSTLGISNVLLDSIEEELALFNLLLNKNYEKYKNT